MSPDPRPITFTNNLLRLVTEADRLLLAPLLTLVQLATRDTLECPNRPIADVYFFESGISSIVGRGLRRKEVEIAMVGREGMIGLPVVMGNDRSPNATFVQLAGAAQRIDADDLRDAMRDSATLRETFLRYGQAFMIQVEQAAGSILSRRS